MIKVLLKTLTVLIALLVLSFILFGVYSYINLGPSIKKISSCQLQKFDNPNIEVRLAYYRATHEIEPFKSRIKEDIMRVKDVLSILPMVGQSALSLSAQSRYGYDFQATTPGLFGEYYKGPNYAFVNMEEQDEVEQGILHEMGGHYLSAKNNLDDLKFLTQEQIDQLIQAEDYLLNSIKRYKNNKDYQDASDRVEDKLSIRLFMINWEELIDASNGYASEIWNNPSSYKEFRGTAIDRKAVEERADKELYAEFTAYLLRAQKRGLFDCSYEHPVLKIFKAIKVQNT